jgi:hypothetical protein
MFPTFGRGKRKGQAEPRWGKNFLAGRVRPIAHKVGIPDHLITFQVMRRTLGTDFQNYGSLKDTQVMLRHGSIKSTADIHVQIIDKNVMHAVNSRTAGVLRGWKAPAQIMGMKGRNVRRESKYLSLLSKGMERKQSAVEAKLLMDWLLR